MKTETIQQVAKKFCQAANVTEGGVVLIVPDIHASNALIQACKEEAEKANPIAVLVQDKQQSAHSSTIYIQTRSPSEEMSWLMAYAPSADLASTFNVSAAEAEDLYIKMCTMDYAAMTKAMKPLAELMGKTKDVHILGRNTDLTLQLESIPAVGIAGVYNIPCGECFSAPVKNSVHGTIQFGASEYNGEKFKAIRMTYENGQVVKAIAESLERTRALNKMLDVDEGARYTGEFAIACNPYIFNPIGNALLDEKISGSLHLAQGHCLQGFAPNENTQSSMHWDLVHIQRPEFGGGEIHFDGKLIRKDGLFVLPELENLNPENLELIV